MTDIDHYIERRNAIQILAEQVDDKCAAEMWQRLGVANRHIDRVLEGTMKLSHGIEKKIQSCLDRAAASADRRKG